MNLIDELSLNATRFSNNNFPSVFVDVFQIFRNMRARKKSFRDVSFFFFFWCSAANDSILMFGLTFHRFDSILLSVKKRNAIFF